MTPLSWTRESGRQSLYDEESEVLPVEEGHTTRALELLVEHSALTPRDPIHVATMESGGLVYLLSTDQDFDGLSQIRRIDPASFLLS